MDFQAIASGLRPLAASKVLAAVVISCLAIPAPAAASAAPGTAREPAPAALQAAMRRDFARRDGAGGEWPEQKVGADDGAAGTNFGYSLAISGATAFVSAYQATIDGHHAQGAVYVYTESAGEWTQTQKLGADDGAAFHQFGESIAFDGTTALIGANGVDGFKGAVYVFGQEDGAWTQIARLTAADGAALDNFGWSVAIDGDTALIGAPYADEGGNSDQGAAYVFEFSGGSWTSAGRLTAPDGAADDVFGRAVAVDGATLLVGAAGASIDGNAMQGAAYVYERVQEAWAPSRKLVASDGQAVDGFGQAVALEDGTAVIGAPLAAAAYVFARDEGAWPETAVLSASDGPAAGSYFGYALDFDGATIAVGALNATIGENTFQGAAYVFDREGEGWSEVRKLVASDGVAFDNLGIAVGVSGATVLAGAYYAAVDGNAAEGAAYSFTRPEADRIFTDGFEG